MSWFGAACNACTRETGAACPAAATMLAADISMSQALAGVCLWQCHGCTCVYLDTLDTRGCTASIGATVLRCDVASVRKPASWPQQQVVFDCQLLHRMAGNTLEYLKSAGLAVSDFNTGCVVLSCWAPASGCQQGWQHQDLHHTSDTATPLHYSECVGWLRNCQLAAVRRHWHLSD